MHKIQALQSFLQYNPKAAYRPTQNKIVVVPAWLQWTCNNLSDASAKEHEFTSMYVFYIQQYNVIKIKLHRSHILVAVYNLPLETILLPIYSKNRITFCCTRCSVWACSRTLFRRLFLLVLVFLGFFVCLFFLKLSIAPCVTSTQRDFSMDHTTTQFKNTDPLLGRSTKGDKLWYKADSRKQRQSNFLVTTLKLKEELIILTFVGLFSSLTHFCHYLQSHSELNINFCQFPCCTPQ